MDAHALIGVQERQVLGLPGLSDLFPFPTKSHSQSTSATATSTSASSTSASSSPASESSTSASSTEHSSSVSSSSSESSSSSSSSTTEVLTSASQDPVFSTATSQSTQTVTAFAVDGSSTPTSTPSPVAHASFLQNKVLSGLVFALAGIVGLVVIVSILTFVIRRKRSRKLVEDAVSFDPVKMGAGYHDALEAGQSKSDYARSRSSTSTGHASNGPEVRQKPSFADYAPPPQMYQPPLANMSPYQAQQGYNHSQQQQAYIQPFSWAAPPQQVDPYRGTRSSAEDAEKPPRRSQSSSAEIQFVQSVLTPAYNTGEAR